MTFQEVKKHVIKHRGRTIWFCKDFMYVCEHMHLCNGKKKKSQRVTCTVVSPIWLKCWLYVSIILELRNYSHFLSFFFFSVIQSVRNSQITYLPSPSVKTLSQLEVGTELIKLIYANLRVISISIILQNMYFLKI